LRQDNSGISTSVAELGSVFEHVCHFRANSSWDGFFENPAVETLGTALHAVVFAPQGGKLGPAEDGSSTEGVHSSRDVQQSSGEFALRSVSMV
jgi:hypothetical protein